MTTEAECFNDLHHIAVVEYVELKDEGKFIVFMHPF